MSHYQSTFKLVKSQPTPIYWDAPPDAREKWYLPNCPVNRLDIKQRLRLKLQNAEIRYPF